MPFSTQLYNNVQINNIINFVYKFILQIYTFVLINDLLNTYHLMNNCKKSNIL